MYLSVFRPATVALLPWMHFHSIDIAKSLSELQVYGLNGEKRVLCINPGRSDRSVPT